MTKVNIGGPLLYFVFDYLLFIVSTKPAFNTFDSVKFALSLSHLLLYNCIKIKKNKKCFFIIYYKQLKREF